MSIQEQIVQHQKELEILKKMQATDFNTIPVNAVFRVSDYLNKLSGGGALLRHFAGITEDREVTFFTGGCTSYTEDSGTNHYSYWELVDTGEPEKESEFRSWILRNRDTDGKLHFYQSCFPKDLPRNYLKILGEKL